MVEPRGLVSGKSRELAFCVTWVVMREGRATHTCRHRSASFSGDPLFRWDCTVFAKKKKARNRVQTNTFILVVCFITLPDNERFSCGMMAFRWSSTNGWRKAKLSNTVYRSDSHTQHVVYDGHRLARVGLENRKTPASMCAHSYNRCYSCSSCSDCWLLVDSTDFHAFGKPSRGPI